MTRGDGAWEEFPCEGTNGRMDGVQLALLHALAMKVWIMGDTEDVEADITRSWPTANM